MASSPLSTYLNDHLAGSVVALRLLESLDDHFSERDGTRALAGDVRQLREEIEADRTVLERLIAEVGGGESVVRKSAGWLAERFAQVKLTVDDDDRGAFRVLEMTEVVALGVLGKRGLWRALQAALDRVPAARGLDLDGLIAAAESQHARMETLRLGAARAAFADRSDAG